MDRIRHAPSWSWSLPVTSSRPGLVRVPDARRHRLRRFRRPRRRRRHRGSLSVLVSLRQEAKAEERVNL